LAYSQKFKEKVLARALAPEANVSDIARRAGIPKATLFDWVYRAKLGSMSSRSKKKKRGRPRKSSRWSAEEKLRILTEAAGLSEEELGAFLRKEGMHDADLEELRQAALAGLEPPKRSQGPTPEEKELKRLRRELNHKEKALAETAALLVLSKKYRAIMGEEDDDTGENSGGNS
jgi:transposase-like protein